MKQVAQAAPELSPPEGELADTAPNLAPPPGNPRFPPFDSLRAVAALSVFLGHTVSETFPFAAHRNLNLAADQLAYQGVAVFFVISGFLLYRPFIVARRIGRRYSLRSYARRRMLRIVPAYWVALTICMIAGFVGGITASNFWVFYGFAQVYSLSTIAQGIGVAWTLCIEVSFYIALPLLALAAARLGGSRSSARGDVALLLCLSVASLAFRARFHSFVDLAKVSTLAGTFVWFALGMGLAVLSVAEEHRHEVSWPARLVARHPGLLWGLAAAASGLLYYLFRTQQTAAVMAAEHALHGLVALFIVLPAVFGESAGGLPRALLRNRALAWIGLISYAFYLYHSIVIAELNKLAAHLALAPRYAFVLVVSAVTTSACAAASYYLVERPIMRMRPLRAQASRRSPP
ncbi:MAG: acyltransferase [Actinomycetota bacterium]|nr:acyltransferase [Actinomycetota bacterium]